jgi:hypothetical protein
MRTCTVRVLSEGQIEICEYVDKLFPNLKNSSRQRSGAGANREDENRKQHNYTTACLNTDGELNSVHWWAP